MERVISHFWMSNGYLQRLAVALSLGMKKHAPAHLVVAGKPLIVEPAIHYFRVNKINSLKCSLIYLDILIWFSEPA